MFTTFYVAAGDVFDFRVTLLLEEADGAGAAAKFDSKKGFTNAKAQTWRK